MIIVAAHSTDNENIPLALFFKLSTDGFCWDRRTSISHTFHHFHHHSSSVKSPPPPPPPRLPLKQVEVVGLTHGDPRFSPFEGRSLSALSTRLSSQLSMVSCNRLYTHRRCHSSSSTFSMVRDVSHLQRVSRFGLAVRR